MANRIQRKIPVDNSKTVYVVTVERATVEVMSVGIHAATEEEAKAKVLALPKIQRNAGWHVARREEPNVVSVVARGHLNPETGRPTDDD